jgi:hypothetical protein
LIETLTTASIRNQAFGLTAFLALFLFDLYLGIDVWIFLKSQRLKK